VWTTAAAGWRCYASSPPLATVLAAAAGLVFDRAGRLPWPWDTGGRGNRPGADGPDPGALGLDRVEGRGFGGWHHHVTLVWVAHRFLILERLRPIW
jgi:hypothetical protein